jgi:hypothetical protein
MSVTRLRAVAWGTLLLLACVVGCQRSDVSWDDAERLNREPGALGRFTSPYYTAIHPLPGGGALVAFMRTDGQYRPFVVRRAADARARFDPEQYLTPEDMRTTVSIGPAIAGGPDAGEVYVAWQARILASGSKFVLFRRSGDGGGQWSPAQTLSSEITPFVPDLAADRDGAVYVAWSDERGSGLNVFFNRSLDHGATWLPHDVLIEPAETPGRSALSVRIASDGAGRVVVVWEDEAKGGRLVYATASPDKGATWSTPVRIDDAKTRLSPAAPQVVFASGKVIVVWTSAATGTSPIGQVWSDVSADGGVTWGEDVLLQEVDGGTASRAHLISNGTAAHVVFHAGNFNKDSQVYYGETDANGSWIRRGEGLTRVTHRSGRFANPRVAVEADGTIDVVYEEDQKRILLDRSRDRGVTWRPEPEVVDAITQVETQERLLYPQLTASEGAVYVTWEHWGNLRAQPKSLVEADSVGRPDDLYVRRARFR